MSKYKILGDLDGAAEIYQNISTYNLSEYSISAIGRLIDYIAPHDEAYNDFGFEDDLSYENRLTIISQMLQKMKKTLFDLDR